MIEAKVICDSISPEGIRLTTMKLRYPKFCHGEFMTHRVFSRNASSSRAIPVSKCIEEVRSGTLRAAPVLWGKNQAGMQAEEELSGVVPADQLDATHTWLIRRRSEKEWAQSLWEIAAMDAANTAEQLHILGAHKQIVNRILEPFLHINVVCTATDYDNFFGLRLDKATQPEMRALALAMWEARQASAPRLLQPRCWHLPFIEEQDGDAIIEDYYDRAYPKPTWLTEMVRIEKDLIKVSCARCARVSYESFETGRRSTVDEDLALYDRLLASKHLSPFEHQATPDDNVAVATSPRGIIENDQSIYGFERAWKNQREHGNLRGWRQYRKQIPNEAVMPLPEEFRTCP